LYTYNAWPKHFSQFPEKIFSIVELKIPLKYSDLIPRKGLGELGKHGHSVGDVIVLVLSGHGVGAEHVHHASVVLLFLIEGIILEEAMLLDPGAVEDDFGLLVGGVEFCGDLGDAATLFHLRLDVLGNSSTGIVMLEAAHLHLVLQQTIGDPRLYHLRKAVVADAIGNVIILSIDVCYRHKSIVGTLVLSVADADDTVRISVRQLKESFAYIFHAGFVPFPVGG